MERLTLRFTVNGRPVEVITPPWRRLVDILRDDLLLIGTKEGCSTGDCGACTVHLDGKLVLSCLVLAPEVEGREVTTIEGLARDGELHPVQEAFVRYGGLQCGICTPGFIMTAVDLLRRHPDPDEHTVRAAVAGNLCRCTGYDKIVRAILAAGDVVEGGKA